MENKTIKIGEIEYSKDSAPTAILKSAAGFVSRLYSSSELNDRFFEFVEQIARTGRFSETIGDRYCLSLRNCYRYEK